MADLIALFWVTPNHSVRGERGGEESKSLVIERRCQALFLRRLFKQGRGAGILNRLKKGGDEMKVKRVIPMALVLMFTFIFYGMVFGEGGPGPLPDRCKPENLPIPSRGPFLQGFFTVALEGEYFYFHVVLNRVVTHPRRNTITHLFYTKIGPKQGPDICDRTDAQLLEKYKWLACSLEVEKPFNLTGTPVITKFSVVKKEFCQDPLKRMIYGTVTIRVVPDTINK